MSSKKPSTPSGPAAIPLARAVRRLLRPLVSLLIQHGFTYSWLVKNLKPIYLEVASSDFKLEDKPLSDSRISLLTGLDRKDIRSLRAKADNEENQDQNNFVGAQIVSIWMTEKRYLDKKGNPAPLPRLINSTDNPEDPSFEELFSLVTKSIKPRAFLDEWLRTGAVTIDSDDRVCIELDSFVSNKTFYEKVFFLENNIHDHIAAAGSNVVSEKPKFPERAIYFNEMSDESIEELRKHSRDEGMVFLKSINKKARKLQQKDAKNQQQDKRMHLGFYFYSDDFPEDSKK